MASWKVAQSKKQVARKIRLALFVLALFFGLIILSQIIKFTQTLYSPWNFTAAGARVAWNGEFNINLIIRAKEISLLSFNPKEGKVTIISIPGETYLPVWSGFGNWQLRSVYDVGGLKVLKNTLSQFFGLPIDGYVEGDLLGSIGKLPALKTDLTLLELLRLKMGLLSVRYDKMEKINLTNLLQPDTLADGTKVLIADPVKLDTALKLAEPAVISEHQTIAIFNATGRAGLAQKAARLVTNMGGDVIIVTNSQSQLKTTTALGKPSKTLQRLKAIFESEYGNIEPIQEDLVSSRAQINLFLGEDYK